MKKVLSILALTMVFTALLSSAVRAEGGKIRFGHLAVIPYLGLEEEYSDNIYYDKRDKEADWISHIKPGLFLDYIIEGRGRVMLGYQGDYAYYAHNSDNNWKNHTVPFLLDYQAPGGLIVKIKNDYRRSSDPYGTDNDYNLGTKTRRWEDDLQSAAGFKFGERFKLLGFYNFLRERYDNKDDFTQDYTQQEVGAGGEYQISHKTWMFLRSYVGQKDFDSYRNEVTHSNDADYDWFRVNTGLAWDEGGHFNGELNFGYQWNSFKNDYDANGYSYRDRDTWIASTVVDYRQTQARKFRFRVERALRQYESGSSGYFMETTFGISVIQKIREKYEVGLGYAYEMWDMHGPQEYRDYSYSTKSERFYYDDMGDKNRKHVVHASFRYFIQEWLTAGVFYEFDKNKADPSWTGYTVNRIMFRLEFKPAFYH